MLTPLIGSCADTVTATGHATPSLFRPAKRPSLQVVFLPLLPGVLQNLVRFRCYGALQAAQVFVLVDLDFSVVAVNAGLDPCWVTPPPFTVSSGFDSVAGLGA